MLVKQCHVYHPPVITILIGGMITNSKWVVYDIVLATLLMMSMMLGNRVFLIVTMILYRFLYDFLLLLLLRCFFDCYYDIVTVIVIYKNLIKQKKSGSKFRQPRLPASSHLATSPQPATNVPWSSDMRHLAMGFKDQ